MSIEDWPLAAALAAKHPHDPGYCVFVRNLVLPVSIGIHAHEKRQRARIRINADLLVGRPLPAQDDFAETLDYETIVSGIRQLADGSHINLVETLADRVAALSFADPRVRAVRVTVEKLDIYPEADSVGVRIERVREDQAPSETAR